MINAKELKVGDSVFWLLNDGKVKEHTYISHVGDIAILSGAVSKKTFSVAGEKEKYSVTTNKDMELKMIAMSKQNDPSKPYPVSFADVNHLFHSYKEAEEVK